MKNQLRLIAGLLMGFMVVTSPFDQIGEKKSSGQRLRIFDGAFSDEVKAQCRNIIETAEKVVMSAMPQLRQAFEEIPEPVYLVVTDDLNRSLNSYFPGRVEIRQGIQVREKLSIRLDACAVGLKTSREKIYVLFIKLECFQSLARTIAVLTHEWEHIRRFWKDEESLDFKTEEMEVTAVTIPRLKVISNWLQGKIAEQQLPRVFADFERVINEEEKVLKNYGRVK